MHVAQLLLQTVLRHPDREALVFGPRRWTYAQWNRRINRLAHALAAAGVRPHDRVALLLPTCEAAATTYFAIQKLGAVAVPMNFRLSPGEVAHILQDSGARVLIYAQALADRVAKVQATSDALNCCICVEPDDTRPHGHRDYEALIDSTPNEAEPATDIGAEQLSALVYTSGTTGRAKGVMHSHANDVAIATNCVMEYSLVSTDRALHIAPLYHVGGMQAYFLPHVFVGAANVLMARYGALETLQAIDDEHITTLFAVPTQVQEMLFHPRFGEFRRDSLRLITSGGAALASATMERVLGDFCPGLFNGYGMTEASLTLLLHPRDALARLGSCGKPTLISSARLVANEPQRDVRPDEEVPIGTVGQLIVRGPQVMAGYWNNPAESAKKLRHGWLYTGDLFVQDADGYFSFQGRSDDMIVSGGENIYPREVEEVLYRCPGVREAAVVGLPDPKWGSVVTAFVERSDAALSRETVDAWCRASDQLAAFKRPRRIEFVDRLPVNPSGKVLKRELVAAYAESTQAPQALQSPRGEA